MNDLDILQREVSEPDVYNESSGRKSLTVAPRNRARDPETRDASDRTADAGPMIIEHNKTPAAHCCAQQESLALNRSGGFPETRDGKLHCLIQVNEHVPCSQQIRRLPIGRTLRMPLPLLAGRRALHRRNAMNR